VETNANRDAHLRAGRRRQAQDALAFEQDRESMLVGELEDVLAEAEGPGLDAGLFAQMSLEEAELVRTALGQDAGSEAAEEPDEDDDFAWSREHGYGAGTGETDEDSDEDTAEDTVEEEVVRLQAEIDSSRRVQAALETYLELLAAPPAR
jgi:hypothetical protein